MIKNDSPTFKWLTAVSVQQRMFPGTVTCFSTLLNCFWPVPATCLPKSTGAQLGVKMQQIAFPTDYLSAATLTEGMRAVRPDAGQLASVPDNTAGLIAIQ